ncbi:transcription factor bHLH121-like protein isoform X2 [Gossypium australe]|uniref:Transcription factor bHLH121-like protein isoform X2 n=1 Tax=Gossypium australe TaxID=47621 RepID=A0A5B6UL37_9ROSI|nr:transcription factor bHLH121-like protein isoform X2 [Gossypium australe]
MNHQWKPNDFSEAIAADLGISNPEPRQRLEMEAEDPIAARKVQKADREKLRRDRLNEQFLELGNTLDPDRPKNDKATILVSAIQMLKDLTAEVNRLKAERSSLTEESRELTQENNELREEKASVKANIENLTVQYQQRRMMMFPWTSIYSSSVMAPPYPYPVPLPVTTGPIIMHSSLQPYQFFGDHNPGAINNPCSTFMPYSTTTSNPLIEQPSSQYTSSSHTSSKRDSKSKLADHQRGSNRESNGSNDVRTKLELKNPGSSTNEVRIYLPEKRKARKKKEDRTNGCSLNWYSSSQDLKDSSSNSVNDVSKSNK